jgi:uncharacterized protein YqeY
MSLIQRINDELKASMKAKNKERTGAIRMIRAGIIEAQKAGKGEVTDDIVVAMLRMMVKQRKDAAEQYVGGGRQDLADIELAEIVVIDEFLPKLADEAQTTIWVDEALAASGATTKKEFGKAMGALMKAHKGDIDAGLARTLIQARLA